MSSDHTKIARRVMAARIDLLKNHPFFGSLAFGMDFVLRDDLNPPTAATDGENIYFHPSFIETMSPDCLVFVLAHEIMHPALMHTIRRGPRDPKLWNIAADIVVNEVLVSSNVGVMPQFCIRNRDVYNKGDGKVERIYTILEQEMEKQGREAEEPGQGGPNSSMDVCMDAPSGSASEQETKWMAKVAQASEVAKLAGKMPAGLEEFVKNILSPKVPWHKVLRNFLVTAKADDRTWAKPNRRYLASGLFLPGITGVKMGEIVIAVDCSGSVGGKEGDAFFSEIIAIQQEVRPEKTHILYFDTEVHKHDTFEHDEDIDFSLVGRGGTAFSPVFNFIDAEGIEPTAVVFLTDLYCDDFGPPPQYPVLWVSTASTEAPFGQVVKMEI